MFVQSWASRFRRQKTSISDVILGPETRRKSFKTEVRKRMGNQAPFGHHFRRFWSDFGAQDRPQNRPKTVPKRDPKRVQRPASFCNRFSTDSRSSQTRKSFRTLKKIDVFAKLGFAVPTPKNVNFGRHFGTRNASKIVQNGGLKPDGK